MLKHLFSAAAALFLAACGGGGGETLATGGTPATRFNPALAAVSYDNFKAIGLQPSLVPANSRAGAVRAYGDFFGNGRHSLFVGRLNYTPQTSTPTTAAPATFEFWSREADGSYTLATTKVSGGTACIHPRKAVVADFNGDGRPDVAVACHGYDASPFPGERMKIVLSEADGRYRIADVATDVGFFHNVAAGDIDGDGAVDLIVVNNADAATAVVFINRRDGSFVRDTTSRMPAAVSNKQYFTVELLDVNGDGKADLFFGGHEWERSSATTVLINPGSGDFANVVPTVVPAVANEGVVLDVTVTGSGATRALWVLRTSGGDGTFYQGRVVQKVLWPSLTSSLPYANRSTPWTPWLIPTTVNGVPVLASDDANDTVVVPL